MKHILFLLLFISSSLVGFAQKSPQKEAERQIMTQASYIFEGQVARTFDYFNADRSRIYHTSEVRITRMIKGSLVAGSVQVTYKGSRVAAVIPGEGNGESLIQVPDDNGRNQDVAGITLPANKTTLFFCRTLPTSFTPAPQQMETTNATSLEIVGLAYDLFGDHSIVSDVGGRFSSLPEVYNYLSQNFQIAKPASERPMTQTQIDSAGASNREQWSLMEQQVQQARENQKKSRNGQRQSSPQTTEAITFTISSPTVTGTGTRYLEYDVFIQGSSGNSYFSNAVMEFSYNTAAFGSNLGASNNNQVTLTMGSSFNSTTYRAPNVVTGNGTTPTFRVGCGVIFRGSNFTRFRLTTTPVQLVHIKIQMTNCLPNSGVEFVNDVDMADYALYANSATTPDLSTTYQFYDPVTFTDYPGGISLCSVPTITSFTPAVKAGTATINSAGSSLLTIMGSGFGTARGTIQMKDADVGGQQYLTLDNYDIDFWSDTEIRVKVPGRVQVGSSSTPSSPVQGSCGSGKFKINTATNASVESSSELDVEYAMQQVLYGNGSGVVTHKARRFLPKYNCVDGYTFRVDNTLKNDPAAIRAIEAALAAWSVKLGVYLALERNAQGTLVGQTSFPSQADGINSISYDVIAGSSLMETHYTSGQTCGTGTSLRYAMTEVDIVINVGNNTNWDYSLQGNVTGYSFLSAFLHEVGHTLGLAHIVTPNTAFNSQRELMFFNTFANPVDANRPTLVSGRAEASAAAVDNVTVSKQQTWCGAGLLTLGSTSSNSCQTVKPLAPSLQAQANASVNRTITLSWNPIYNATGYTIQTALSPTATFSDYASIFSGSVGTYTTGNLDPVTPYYFRIKATNAAGSSGYSNIANATTSARAASSPVVAPVSFQGTSLSGPPLANQLSWSYATSGATFKILRATNIEFTGADEFVTAVNATSYTDTDITAGTVYFYRVIAQTPSGNSDDSAPISLAATGCTPLGNVGPIELMGIRGPQYSNDFFCVIQQAQGVVSYTWNFTSPTALTEGWSLSGGFESVVARYSGPIPYQGSTTTLQVEVASNCGTTDMRYFQLPTPVYGAGQADSRTAQPAAGIKIYPNPAHGELLAELPENWTSSRVRLIDMKTGEPLREWQADGKQFKVTLDEVPAGIYIVEFSTADNVSRQRLEVAP